MENINYREIHILGCLLNNEIISAKKLIKEVGISLRTLQDEINRINDWFFKGNLAIKVLNKRGKGYYLEYEPEHAEYIQELRRQCHAYLNSSINNYFSHNPRVPYICWQLFLSPKYTKVEALAESMNVSSATINKDLPLVREFLSKYSLSIDSAPYYGMFIVGEELAIRSCMVDLFNVDSYLIQTSFYDTMMRQYNVDEERINRSLKHVKENIINRSYLITDTGIQRISKYLIIMELRNQRNNIISRKEQDIIKEFREFKLAQILVGKQISMEELCALTLFILVNSELTYTAERSLLDKLLPKVTDIKNTIIYSLLNKYKFNLKLYPEILNFITNFIYIFRLRKKYSLKELEISESKKEIINKFPSSIALAIYIYTAIPNYNKKDLQDHLFTEFVLHLYNYANRISNEYYSTHIILVNSAGTIANEQLIRKLDLEHFNVYFHVFYLYELDSIDYTKYDYVFISEDINYNLCKIPIPSYTFKFFLNDSFLAQLWDEIFLKKRKIGSVTNYLTHPEVIEVSGNKKEIFEKMILTLKKTSKFDYRLKDSELKDFVKVMMNKSTYNKQLKTKTINFFSTHEIKNRFIIFQLADPIEIKGEIINKVHFIFLDVSKGIVEIKNGDSEIRRFYEDSE